MKFSVILLLLIVLQINSLTCSGNCPSDTCDSCWCPQKYNIVNITNECQKFDWDQNCCQCIMMKVSGGNANAISQLGKNPPKGPLTGLWQLDELVRQFTCELQMKESLCQPTLNMQCAYKLYQLNLRLGQWNPWKKQAMECGCSSKLLVNE